MRFSFSFTVASAAVTTAALAVSGAPVHGRVGGSQKWGPFPLVTSGSVTRNASFNGYRDGAGYQVLDTFPHGAPAPEELFYFLTNSQGTNVYGQGAVMEAWGQLKPSKFQDRCITARSPSVNGTHFNSAPCASEDDADAYTTQKFYLRASRNPYNSDPYHGAQISFNPNDISCLDQHFAISSNEHASLISFSSESCVNQGISLEWPGNITL